MVDTEKNILFICACNDAEHQLIFSYFEDDDYPEVYTSVHLNPERKWYKRIIHALKYVFGYRCKYGDFDEFIFKPKDYSKLQEVVNYLKNAYEKEKKHDILKNEIV